MEKVLEGVTSYEACTPLSSRLSKTLLRAPDAVSPLAGDSPT